MNTMKKMMVILAVLVFVLLLGSTCQAQTESPKSWVVGKWIGFRSWWQDSYALEIFEKDGKLSAMYALLDRKATPYPISIDFDGTTLTFTNSSKSKFFLTRTSERRMDGKYVTKEGAERIVRFWKEGEASASPLLGIWKGKLVMNVMRGFARQEISVEVLFIDESAMTIAYKWGDVPEIKTEGGWMYINCEKEASGKYVSGPDPGIGNARTFLFKNENKLFFEFSGKTTNSMTLEKDGPGGQVLKY